MLVTIGASVVGWRRLDADLVDANAVSRAMSHVSPSHIIHLAAAPSAPVAADWQYVAHEVAMVTNLVDAMPEDCRLIQAGSMAEFGYSGRFDETAICRPSSPYGAAKAAATDRTMALRLVNGRAVSVARLFGVYGPGEATHRLLPHVVRSLATEQPVLLSAGDQIRDFVHVDDVCTTLIALARSPDLPRLVHIGTGVGLTVRRVCETVADILGASRDLLNFGALPYRAVDEMELVADIGLLARHATVPSQRWLDPSLLAKDFRALLSDTDLKR